MKRLQTTLGILILLLSAAHAAETAPDYGPKPLSSGVRFRYYIPSAASVAVAGDFNNWQPFYLQPLKSRGAFEGVIPAALFQDRQKYRYKLIVNGIWQPDPVNGNREYDQSGNLLSWFRIPSRIVVYAGRNPRRIGENMYRFTYRNDSAGTVYLVGTFNDFDPYRDAMKKDPNGIWTIDVQVLPGKHHYNFIVDGRWIIDPTRIPVTRNRFGRPFTYFTAP